VYHQHPVEVLEPDAVADLPETDTLLVQVTSSALFEQAHIPGAVLIEPAELVCGIPPASGKLPSTAQIAATLSRVGYQPDQRIIAFDDEGGGWAGRLFWTLDVIGHYDWAYLDGGLHAWHAAGLPLAQGASAPVPAEPCEITVDTDPIAEIPDVIAAIDDADSVIWDVRSAEEYAGLRSGSARRGHIPGAVNLDWELLKDANRQLRLIDSLDDVAASLGLLQAKQIITHCQTHHRSGLSYLVGRLLGLNIKAFHGAWAEWGNDPNTPITNPSEAAH
jgi:thiosulfate/3-mercaptopyruvate sulfurtransferase|tara:strand:+ start:1218 stop:2045 length:828 start_codon:yes stop_codon:yes gene_type:complete